MKKQQILITISGEDKPGVTAALMKVIVRHNEKIIDMGQAVTHGLLSLSILLESNQRQENKEEQELDVLKDLLFTTKLKGMEFDFKVIDSGQGPALVKSKSDKFILSCVSVNDITPSFIQDVADLFAKNKINIVRIDNVHPSNFKCLEITTSVPSALDDKGLKSSLMNISNHHQIDVAFLKDNVYRRSKRLIVFDMDSTLIQTEVIDEMAKEMGVEDQVASITHQAMEGKIDFNESLLKRVSFLKGLKEEKLKIILDRLEFTQGAEDFVKTVQSLGYKIALISGGFTYFANALKDKLGLDYAFANELDIKNGELTGEIQGTIVNAEQKAMLVNLIAQQEKINIEQVVAIGDGANDLPMLSTAGLGIAYHAKEIVKKMAPNHMGHGPMTSILYFLGIPGTNL